MGEFYAGQTVPLPVSPADGYAYSTRKFSYVFLALDALLGSVFTVPDHGIGQLDRIGAAVSSSAR